LLAFGSFDSNRLFFDVPVLISTAHYLLSHPTFPWQSVGALLHYDGVDSSEWTGLPAVAPSSRLRKLVQEGVIASWRLDTKVEESRVLWSPLDRQLERLELPKEVPFKMFVHADWLVEHKQEAEIIQASEVGLIQRDIAPATFIVDASTAVSDFAGW
jgi:hypothetical protein